MLIDRSTGEEGLELAKKLKKKAQQDGGDKGTASSGKKTKVGTTRTHMRVVKAHAGGQHSLTVALRKGLNRAPCPSGCCQQTPAKTRGKGEPKKKMSKASRGDREEEEDMEEEEEEEEKKAPPSRKRKGAEEAEEGPAKKKGKSTPKATKKEEGGKKKKTGGTTADKTKDKKQTPQKKTGGGKKAKEEDEEETPATTKKSTGGRGGKKEVRGCRRSSRAANQPCHRLDKAGQI